ncbi:MAG: Helicase associated domain protein [Oscillospiraceae bacterium]|nr:Helicase associated domain protein [Oscillospiraceae bacterium]
MSNRKTESWNVKYELAKQYYTEKENLLIPSSYETTEGIKLGMWISRQRRDYFNNKLSKKKIELLEKIEMVWSVSDAQWFENYGIAKKYYIENGNLLIPLKYTTNSGIKIGSWIGSQRKQYKDRKLSKDRIELLEKIGMLWSVYDEQWYENYNSAIEYYNKYGDLLVPLRYITTNNKKLGVWISFQRNSYKSGKLTAEKIELLEKYGMVWDGTSAIWEEMYKVAKLYYEENNNLSISNTRFVYQNVSLGSWIITQRKNYVDNKLTDKQISILNEIGMEWVYSYNPDYIWEKNNNKVLEFFSKYKHLYIPINYTTDDGIQLGVWLYDRKLEYEKNELSEYRKRKLDKLDKTWLESINTKSSFPEQAVLYYISQAFPSATKLRTNEISEIDIYIPELKVGIEYDGPFHNSRIENDVKKSEICKKHGIDLIRIRHKDLPIIRDKSYTIVLKDDSFAALDKAIIELINYLMSGDTWVSVDVKRDYFIIADKYIKMIDLDWYSMYEKLKEYHKEYGNINVPIYYKTSDGLHLGHWLSSIRNSYKKPNLGNNRLNSYNIELLEELGIDWSPLETQWKNMYLLAKRYYEDNGHLIIPNKYVTAENINLGRWIGTQRLNYKESKLTKEKALLLEKIGMIWDMYEYNWMKMFDLAKTYYMENSDLLIQSKYKTNNICLGSWIAKQRKEYKGNRLTKEKIDLLESIGMVWDLKNT